MPNNAVKPDIIGLRRGTLFAQRSQDGHRQGLCIRFTSRCGSEKAADHWRIQAGARSIAERNNTGEDLRKHMEHIEK